MTHWYGWLALAIVVGCAIWDIRALVINAWRGYYDKYAVFWIAVWVTVTVALVLA